MIYVVGNVIKAIRNFEGSSKNKDMQKYAKTSKWQNICLLYIM